MSKIQTVIIIQRIVFKFNGWLILVESVLSTDLILCIHHCYNTFNVQRKFGHTSFPRNDLTIPAGSGLA